MTLSELRDLIVNAAKAHTPNLYTYEYEGNILLPALVVGRPTRMERLKSLDGGMEVDIPIAYYVAVAAHQGSALKAIDAFMASGLIDAIDDAIANLGAIPDIEPVELVTINDNAALRITFPLTNVYLKTGS